MKKYIFIISFIILSFGFYKVSFAYTLYQQGINDTETNNSTAAKSQFLGANLTDTWTQLKIYAKSSQNDFINGSIQVCESSTDCSFPSTVACTYSSSSPSTLQYPIGTSKTLITFNLYSCPAGQLTDNPFTITSTSSYKFFFDLNSTTSTITSYGSNASTSYINGPLDYCGSDCGSVQDLFFQINASGSIPTAISITYPPNQSTVQEFQQWTVRASGEIPRIQINYENGYSSFTDTKDIYSTTNGYININISKSHTLGNSTTSFKSATPYIISSTGTIMTTGTTIFFMVDTSGSTSTNTGIGNFLGSLNSYVQGFAYPDASSTETSCNVFNAMGCFVNALTTVTRIAFVPSASTTEAVANQLLEMQSVFPFSIPMTLMNATMEYTSSTPTDLSFAVPFPWATSTSFKVFNSSTLTNTVGNTTKNSYFEFIRLILYIGTGMIMFSTIAL